jgi:DNA ligase-1
MPEAFKDLAILYTKLEKETSYLKIRDTLAEFFKKIPKTDVKTAAYLTLGTVGQSYQKTDLGIAEKMAMRAVSEATGASQEKIKRLLKQKGDLGDAAATLSKKTKSKLKTEEVHKTLLLIRDTSGEGSQDRKIRLLSELLKKATPDEARYIIRISLAKLRLGVADKTILDAFAIAFTGDIKNKQVIEESYNVCTDIGRLGQALAKKGIKATEEFEVEPGRPVQSMLAQRVKTVPEILEKMPGEISAEEKYDGERMQIHKDGNKITAFSRRLEDITTQYPEIIEAVRTNIQAKTAVLDGEVVAYKDGKVLSFQHLMQRRRKHNIEEYRKKVPTAIFLFDILYLNGKSLLKKTYPERKDTLKKVIKESQRIRLARCVTSARIDVIQSFFDKSIKAGLEGIIAKSTTAESIYQPGKRGWSWIKWKKEYAKGMMETFDLVIVGSYGGKGTRTGLFGALLCASYNKKKATYETFTKVGSGFSEKDMQEIKKRLNTLKISEKPASISVEKTMRPDTYYQPKIVIEVLGAEITKSPNHTTGKDTLKTGLALRFPRYIRIREDKGPTDATTTKEIKQLFQKK